MLCSLVLLLAAVGSVSPVSPGSFLKQGDDAVARGNYLSAVKLYSSAVEADPSSPLLLQKRAAAYVSLGQHRTALKDLDKAVSLDPKQMQAHLHRQALAGRMQYANQLIQLPGQM